MLVIYVTLIIDNIMNHLQISRTVNANIQKKINRSIIYHYLCEHDHAYRAKIAEDLKISAPAVSRAIDKLVADNFVIEASKIATAKGKKATRLMVNTEKGIIIGIDLIKERTRFAISNFKGEIINSYSGFKFYENIDVKKEISYEVDRIASVYNSAKGSGEFSKKLQGICIGIPAVTRDTSGTSISTPLYSSLERTEFIKDLESIYGVPVYVENIVKLSALAEKKYGIAKDYKNIIFIEVSNGIGAGIILENRLIRGTAGASGEIGFSIINTENLNYKTTNNLGFLEKNASLEGIKKYAREQIAAGKKSSISIQSQNDPEKINSSLVCKAAMEGDGVAKEIINRSVQYLSVCIINLSLCLNPDIVVLGGDICKLPGIKTLFLDPIAQNMKSIIPFRPPHINKSALQDDAGVLGATNLAIEFLIGNYFPYKLSNNSLR